MDEWRYCRALCEDDGELPELLLLSHECPELQDKVATIPRRREGPDLPRLADRRRRLRPRDADGRAPLSRVRRVRRAASPGVRLEQDAVLGGVLDGAGRELDPRSDPGPAHRPLRAGTLIRIGTTVFRLAFILFSQIGSVPASSSRSSRWRSARASAGYLPVAVAIVSWFSRRRAGDRAPAPTTGVDFTPREAMRAPALWYISLGHGSALLVVSAVSA